MCGLSFTMTYVFLLFFAFYYLWRPKDFLKKYENLSSDLKNNKIGINRYGFDNIERDSRIDTFIYW